jgi:hypothetical protein
MIEVQTATHISGLEQKMAFNIHITRIDERTPSGELTAKSGKVNQNRVTIVKQPEITSSLINVPTDRVMNKYPVRIFELQPQEQLS